MTEENDNHGFARWVCSHQRDIANILGLGFHYGEWWGPGINGNRHNAGGLHFSVFPKHVDDVGPMKWVVGGVLIQRVPLLYEGPFSWGAIEQCFNWLKEPGSRTYSPEGIVILHETGWQNKWTYKEGHKGLTHYQETATKSGATTITEDPCDHPDCSQCGGPSARK